MSGQTRKPFVFGRIGPEASARKAAPEAARRPPRGSASAREVLAKQPPSRDEAAKSKIVSALRKLHPME